MVSKSIFTKILILIFSVTVTLIGIEKFLAGFFPQPLVSNLTRGYPNCFAVSDYLPFTLKPNCIAHQESVEFSVTISTNNLGFRNKEFQIEKSPSEYRILIVGDSMVFGHGVELEQTFSQLLESKISNSQVINAGFAAGFSPDSYYLFLKKNIDKLKPDLVIFAIFPFNDITDLKDNTIWTQTDDSGLPIKIIDSHRVVSPEGYLIEKNSPFYYRSKILGNSHLIVLFGKTLSKVSDRFSAAKNRSQPRQNPKTALDYYLCLFHNQCFPEMDNLFSITEKLILAAKKLSDENNSQFTLLVLPADVQVDENAWEKYQAGKFGLADPPYPQTRFHRLTDKGNVDVVDPLPLFLENKNSPLFFLKDGHINSQGHKLVAESLFQYLNISLTNQPRSHTILP